MQIKVPFRDIAIIIIICNRESFKWFKFHARIFVFLAHFADNLAHPDINLRSGSPAKNNSCSSYHIGMELTALSLKCFFVATIGFGRGVHACMSNSECCFLGGGRLKKNRGPQELSQEEQKQLQQGGCLQPLGSEKSS